MLDEFFARYRGRLTEANHNALMALRRCASLEDLRKTQGQLDGLDLARLMFDETIREWTTDDHDSD